LITIWICYCLRICAHAVPSLFRALASLFRSLAKSKSSPIFPIVATLCPNSGVPQFLPKLSARGNLQPPCFFTRFAPSNPFRVNSFNSTPAHVPSLPSPRELRPPSNQPSSRPRRAWLDELSIVDTMMVAASPTAPSPSGRRPCSNVFTTIALFGSDFSSDRHPRLASLRRPARRPPSVARQQHLPSIALTRASRTGLAAPRFKQRWRNAAVVRTSRSLASSARCWASAAPSLLRRAPLPPGDEHGSPVAFALVSANIINAVGTTFSSTANGLSQHGHRRLRVVHRRRARLHGARASCLFALYDRKHRTELLKTPIDIDFPRIKRPSFSAFPPRCNSLWKRSLRVVTALIARSARSLLRRTKSRSTPSPSPIWFRSESPALPPSASAGHRTKRRTRRRSRRQHRHFLGAVFMTIAGIILLVFPGWIARVYTPDVNVIRATGMCSPQALPFNSSTEFNRRHRRPARRRRHAHADALPLHGLLDHRPAAWLLALFFARNGRSRPLVGLSLALIMIGIVYRGLAPRSLRTFAQTIRMQNENRNKNLHLVAAEVFVGKAFEIAAELFAGCAFRERGRNLGILQDLLVDKIGQSMRSASASASLGRNRS